jgi:hypothetical protein
MNIRNMFTKKKKYEPTIVGDFQLTDEQKKKEILSILINDPELLNQVNIELRKDKINNIMKKYE